MDKIIKGDIQFFEYIKEQVCKITPEMQSKDNILRKVCPNIFYNCEERLEFLKSKLKTSSD